MHWKMNTYCPLIKFTFAKKLTGCEVGCVVGGVTGCVVGWRGWGEGSASTAVDVWLCGGVGRCASTVWIPRPRMGPAATDAVRSSMEVEFSMFACRWSVCVDWLPHMAGCVAGEPRLGPVETNGLKPVPRAPVVFSTISRVCGWGVCVRLMQGARNKGLG